MMGEEKKKVKGISASVEKSSNCSTLVASLSVRIAFFSLWLPKVSMGMKATRGHLKKKMIRDQLRFWSN